MSNDKEAKLVGMFFLGLVLMTFPVINLFEQDSFIGGIPLLYIYIFVVWLILIIIVRRILQQK